MRRLITAIVWTTILCSASFAGPMAAQFRSGFGGVAWGTSLTNVVGVLPEGDHHFSTAPGHRVYFARNDEPILGVPRAGTRVQYHLGENGGVEMIGVEVPYERRDQLVGAAVSMFGAYASARAVGGVTIYRWPADDGITIEIRCSTEPRFGILEFWINRSQPNGVAVRSK
jgi:hypothetical protein